MKIYFSIDTEVDDSLENTKKLMNFLQSQGHTLYRAPYAISNNRNQFMRKDLGLNRDPTKTEIRDIHIKWIDNSDLLLADISYPSEGMWRIIQRAKDNKDFRSRFIPIILIKNKKIERKFGEIVTGELESGDVVYYEYDSIDDVINIWPTLVEKAKSKK